MERSANQRKTESGDEVSRTEKHERTAESSRSVSARLRTGRRVAWGSVFINLALAAGNIGLGLLAGSTSVVAVGFEFLGDVIASCAVLAGLWIASRPPDDNHPYGHGRVETLAGLGVGIILLAGGIGICYQSLQRVSEFHPPPEAFGLWSLGFAVIARTVMSVVKFRIGRSIDSVSLVADAWNDAVDVVSAMAAITALALTVHDPARFLAADHYGGFVVGVIVVFTGLRAIREASLQLMDTMPPGDLIEEVRIATLTVPRVVGVEKCFARRTGLQFHVDIHIEVDPSMTVAESHEVAGAVRSHIRSTLDWVADILVHVEPGPSFGLGGNDGHRG